MDDDNRFTLRDGIVLIVVVGIMIAAFIYAGSHTYQGI